MARTVYVTGTGRGDGRQVVDLGMMELLTRKIDKVGVFRPIVRDASGNYPLLDLLRRRYRIDLDPALLRGMTLAEAAAVQAEHGTEELVDRLVQSFRKLEKHCEAVLVLGASLESDSLPDELALNARLANEFGALVLPVAGGLGDNAEDVVAEARNAYRAYRDLGCDILAVIANRIAPEHVETVTAGLARHRDGHDYVPAYVLPEDPVLSAPTVAQMMSEMGGSLVLGTPEDLDRDVQGLVFGGATLPTFLTHLTDRCLVVTPGDRSDLVVGTVAAHTAGQVSVAGIVLTLGEVPSPTVLDLTAKLAPGLPVVSVEDASISTAARLYALESKLSADSPRKIDTALGLFERHVDTADLSARLDVARSPRVTPLMFEHELLERARADRRHVVLPEGDEERVLRAAEVLLRRDVVDLTLLGPEAEIRRKAAELSLDINTAQIIDPVTSPLRTQFAQTYADLRAHKGMTFEQAHDRVTDVNYFGTLMVQLGLADGMVSGSAHTTAATIRPAFEIIKTVPGTSVVSSVFFMCLAEQVLVYGDCAVIPDPDADQLADIAVSSAATAARFGVDPRVALLSYSTGASGSGADVDKVRQATALVRERRPDLPVEGPIQYDAAVDAGVAATKLPDSPVAGKATVLIFPDLNTGNNTYKAVQRSAGAIAVGPVLQGLRKPVNDLSRGALVQDIVNTVAITAIQAQGV